MQRSTRNVGKRNNGGAANLTASPPPILSNNIKKEVITVEIGTETDMAFVEDYMIDSQPIAALVDDPFPENPFEEIAEIYSHSDVMGDNRYYFVVEFNGKMIRALCDPGSMSSYVKFCVVNNLDSKIMTKTNILAKGALGGVSKIIGLLPTSMTLDDANINVDFKVSDSIAYDMILGIDCLKKFKLKINFGDGTWKIGDGPCKKFENNAQRATMFADCAGIVELTVGENTQLQDLLDELLPSGEPILGCAKGIFHEIKLTEGATPVKQQSRRCSPAIIEELHRQIQEMYELDIVEPCSSPWASQPVMVRKTNGKWRVCIDYRPVNALTVKHAYPIPNLEGMLDQMRKARYISVLDLKMAYNQIPLHPDSRDITAVAIPGLGLFRFKRLTFGLTNAPATWCRLMRKILGPEFEPYAGAYFDDIYIATETFEEHLYWLRRVITALKNAGLSINREKCDFCASSVIYLGYRVDEKGLSPDNERIQPIVEYPAPTNIKQLRRFLGMIGWYSRFINNIAELKLPLGKLLHKDVQWEWGDDKLSVDRQWKRV